MLSQPWTFCPPKMPGQTHHEHRRLSQLKQGLLPLGRLRETAPTQRAGSQLVFLFRPKTNIGITEAREIWKVG